ncbi:MAG: TlpA disulfide reductase family protein [Bacteroidota bacterium]|nr:TlpA disulfide reductase family protein [Bacteroidota bacterium]
MAKLKECTFHYNRTMIKSLRIFLLLIISFSVSFQASSQKIAFKEFIAKPVNIKGWIENYTSDFKTGRLTYFDAVTRSPKDEVFAIDSAGSFQIKFDAIHEVYGCVSLNIQKKRYDIYTEPLKSYDVLIKNDKLEFNNSENSINDELASFKTALYNQLESEIEKARSAHNQNYTIAEYVEILKDLERKKLSFLKSYQVNHPLKSSTVEILQNNIRYETAKAWINIRYDYRGKQPVPRDSLPKDFYSKIFAEYPINSNNGYMVREYIDYIANIGEVMDKTKTSSTADRINFYKSFNLFSEEELRLIAGVYNGDTTVFQSAEFKKFNSNKDKIIQEYELRNRFVMKSILNHCSELPKGIGRDFVLAQQIAHYYFEKDFSPTDKEWNLYNDFFSNKSILNYLKSISPNRKQVMVSEKETRIQNQTAEYSKSITEKYFKKHFGKIIYVDFWATWCEPCKQEIPFAKTLHAELKNKNIVFINFCVKSERATWQKVITDEKIEGENYLLNEDEFNILSQNFRVKGYPTYILIGKDGEVVNYAAPRPSSEHVIINEINRLLK